MRITTVTLSLSLFEITISQSHNLRTQTRFAFTVTVQPAQLQLTIEKFAVIPHPCACVLALLAQTTSLMTPFYNRPYSRPLWPPPMAAPYGQPYGRPLWPSPTAAPLQPPLSGQPIRHPAAAPLELAHYGQTLWPHPYGCPLTSARLWTSPYDLPLTAPPYVRQTNYKRDFHALILNEMSNTAIIIQLLQNQKYQTRVKNCFVMILALVFGIGNIKEDTRTETSQQNTPGYCGWVTIILSFYYPCVCRMHGQQGNACQNGQLPYNYIW